jgi:hypothetical protein
VLLVMTAWMSPYSTLKRASLPAALSLAIVGSYLVLRVIAGFQSAPTAVFSGYALKEMLSRPFGLLGLPFHSRVLSTVPWLAVVLALLWPAMFVGSVARRWATSDDGRLLFGLSLWVLVTVAPLASMLFIGDDLQGSRYLYAGSAAWALMIVTLLRWLPSRAGMALAGVLCLSFGYATRVHLGPWMEAAAERDRVLVGYQQAQLGCRPVRVDGLPDQVEGAYVFRNGFAEAVAKPPVSGEPCVIEWSGGTFRRTDGAMP